MQAPLKDSIAHHGRVEYNDLKNYKHIFMSAFDPKEYSEVVFKKLFHNLFFNKAKYHSIENEYRFAVNNGNDDCSLEISSKINKVVIAENANEEDMKSIVRLCHLFEIEVGRMYISNDRLEYFRIAPT